MSRKKVSPEAQIIALFTGLSGVGKQMVMFGLNAIMSNEAPKPAPVARNSGPRRTSTAKVEPPAQKDLPVDKPVLCGACGNTEDYEDHFEPSPHYHKFEPPKPVASVTRRSSRKGAGTKFIPSTAEERASVLTVGASGE